MRFLRRKPTSQPEVIFYPVVLLEHVDPFESQDRQSAYIHSAAEELRKRWPGIHSVVVWPESQTDQAKTAEQLAQVLGLQAVRWPFDADQSVLAQLRRCAEVKCRDDQPLLLVASRTFNGKVAQHAINALENKLNKLSTFMLYVVVGTPDAQLERLD